MNKQNDMAWLEQKIYLAFKDRIALHQSREFNHLNDMEVNGKGYTIRQYPDVIAMHYILGRIKEDNNATATDD